MGPGGACVRRRGAPVPRHNGTMASPSLHLKRSDHITDALVSLHWLRVPERIYNRRSPCWVTEFFTVARRDTWDRSHASLTFLVDGPSVQPPPTASSCRRSNCLLSAAELFRLSLPPSGTRSLNTSSVHLLYSHFNSTPSEKLTVPTFISGHSTYIHTFILFQTKSIVHCRR